MPLLFRFLLLACPLLGGPAHAAAPDDYLGAPGCRIAPLLPAPAGGAVSWSGACTDGFAHGKGTLAWRDAGNAERKLEATLVHGEVAGEGTLNFENGTYIGTFRKGIPHGSGYFQLTNGGGLYEGGVSDGLPDGAGTHMAIDRSTYTGQWKAGRRTGHGKAVFAEGGSYEGEWLDNCFHGKGRIVYAGSGRSHEGEWINGRDVRTVSPDPVPGSRFSLMSERPPLGTLFREARATSATPINASWGALTPTQRDAVRSTYPALEPGDDPPYPLHGTQGILAGTSEIYRYFPTQRGRMLIHILVGADGKPQSVTTFGAPDAQLAREISKVAMGQRYKPAMCREQPCAMVYVMRMHFTDD
jgi:hypothetical protein